MMSIRSEILPLLVMLFCGAMTILVIHTRAVPAPVALFVLGFLTSLYVWEVRRDKS
jgi:hypothetical protein